MSRMEFNSLQVLFARRLELLGLRFTDWMDHKNEALLEHKELSEYVCSPAEAAISIAFGTLACRCFDFARRDIELHHCR